MGDLPQDDSREAGAEIRFHSGRQRGCARCHSLQTAPPGVVHQWASAEGCQVANRGSVGVRADDWEATGGGVGADCTVDYGGDELCHSDAVLFRHLEQLWEVVARQSDKWHAQTQRGEEDGGDAVDVREGEEAQSHIATAATRAKGRLFNVYERGECQLVPPPPPPLMSGPLPPHPLRHVGDEVGVRELHPLGAPAGA